MDQMDTLGVMGMIVESNTACVRRHLELSAVEPPVEDGERERYFDALWRAERASSKAKDQLLKLFVDCVRQTGKKEVKGEKVGVRLGVEDLERIELMPAEGRERLKGLIGRRDREVRALIEEYVDTEGEGSGNE